MKYLETILDEMPKIGGRRPSAVRGVDLDEDLFLPAPAGLPATRSSRAPDPADMDERPWPTLELPPQPGLNALEKKIVEQATELSMRCTQVADLYNLQERQAAELHVAYAEIERLNAAFAELEQTATQHAKAAAERKQAVTALHQENAILRSQLNKALDDHAQVSTRMLTVETMFNDREMVVTMALEQADLLKAELAATAEEKARLTRTIEAAEQLHQDDRDRKGAIIDELNRKLESLFADNSVQLKTREKLAKRCDELAKTNASLESAHKGASAKIAAQNEHATFLDTVLRVERETAKARAKELTDRLEHERTHRAAADQAWRAMRQEMANLLKHIARRRADDGPLASATAPQDAAHQDAA